MTTALLSTKAPAKINLRLRVTGRRADGYHLLSMWNVFVELYDDVQLLPLEDGRVEIDCQVEGEAAQSFDKLDLELLNDPLQNIAAMAAKRLLKEHGLGARVSILKRIPSGAGLGGGSSDAATVLRLAKDAITRLRGVVVSNGDLFSVGFELGADVPFFLGCTAAIVEGVGESIAPFRSPALDGRECALVFPLVRCGTPEVYRILRQQRPEDVRFEEDSLLKGVAPNQVGADWPKLVENDLEPAAFTLHPRLAEFSRELKLIPDTVSGLTGSGSTFFILPKTDSQFSALTKDSIRLVVDRLKGKHLFSRILQRIC